jgi:hypothetical protein
LVILGIKVLVEWCSFPTADGIPWGFWYLKIDHTGTRLCALYKDPLPDGIWGNFLCLLFKSHETCVLCE